MARPKSHRDLIVWQKAMALAREAYLLTRGLPKNEAQGLLIQIRRAAVSVPSNIAEGHGRLTDLQFRHFLGNARGSLCEMQTQIELAVDLGFLDGRKARELLDQGIEVARLMNALIASLGKTHRQSKEASEASGRANSANAANAANSAKE
jgi:four helix bundle protein